MTMLSVTAAVIRISNKMNSDTHMGNVLLKDDPADSSPSSCPGNEHTHAVFITVTSVLKVTDSVTVITCKLVAIDALLSPVGKQK